MNSILRRFVPDPFLFFLLLSVLLASIVPVHGDGARALNWLTTASIVLLFFFHGAKTPRAALLDAFRHWRLHICILAASFLIFPIYGLLLNMAAPSLFVPALWTGILFLCTLPSTVQSSVAFTAVAGGNVPGAIAAASISNLLGIVLSPLLINLLANARGHAVQLGGIGSVVAELLVPLIAGQLLAPWLGEWTKRNRKLVMINDRGAIILSVYGAFSAAVIEGIWSRIAPETLLVLFAVLCVLLGMVMATTFFVGRRFGFDRGDQIVILFCGSKKSLASGVPMARVLFTGPDAGIILLPLMIFHQVQLMGCAWLAKRFAADGVERTRESDFA
jgi:sodium/bile acid cotransporter 7